MPRIDVEKAIEELTLGEKVDLTAGILLTFTEKMMLVQS